MPEGLCVGGGPLNGQWLQANGERFYMIEPPDPFRPPRRLDPSKINRDPVHVYRFERQVWDDPDGLLPSRSRYVWIYEGLKEA